jgi:hypothetical protein
MKKKESLIIILGSVLIGIILISIVIINLSGPKSISDTKSSLFDKNKYEVDSILIQADTNIINVIDQVTTVHSRTNIGSIGNISGIIDKIKNPDYNPTIISFELPEYAVTWAYYIGVNQTGRQVYLNASERIQEASIPLLFHFNSYDPLTALALNLTSFLVAVQSEENVKYWIVDSENLELLRSHQQFSYLKNGDVVTDFARMTSPLKGQLHLCLVNDNWSQAINVMVKITAICVDEQWGIRRGRRK